MPTQQKVMREEYLAYLRSLVLQFDLKIRTYERVVTARSVRMFWSESRIRSASRIDRSVSSYALCWPSVPAEDTEGHQSRHGGATTPNARAALTTPLTSARQDARASTATMARGSGRRSDLRSSAT